MDNNTLSSLRSQLDDIDSRMVELFVRRARISREIGSYKKQNALAVLDKAREEEKLAELSRLSGEELAAYTQRLYRLIFEISRELQKDTND